MDTFRVLEIKKSVYENNDQKAQEIRTRLKEKGIFLLNLMSSPGSGKTTTVMQMIKSLKPQYSLGVMEADLDSDVDAKTVSESGAKVIQLHSGGMCHLDASMTDQGLKALGEDNLDCIILENIGNLICTAEFDTGASKNAMILSVPEGDDKPLKYPGMFAMVDLLIVNKIDTLCVFDFSLELLEKRVRALNPNITIIPISAKTGEGIDHLYTYLDKEISLWKKEKVK